MDAHVIAIARRFFARSAQPKLRRDLARELAASLELDGAAAEALIDSAMAEGYLCGMRVHYYDPDREDVVQEPGVPALRLDREIGSGYWRAVPAPV